MKTFSAEQLAILNAEFPTGEVRSQQLYDFDKGLFRIATNGGAKKLARGLWQLPTARGASPAAVTAVVEAAPAAVVSISQAPHRRKAAAMEVASNVPAKDKTYVKFGEFALVKSIVASNKFFPVFITGESGNGKTFMVQQACADAKRELFRVNFTGRTDEGELIGETGLVNGDTVFEEGIVITAMRRGGVLLLDELDYASAEGFTPLQSIMEGSPYLIKKTGELVQPAPGFTIIATANTKGQGDASGKYYGAQLLNEAFLERFPIVIEQDYPSESVEVKIMQNVAEAEGITLSDDDAILLAAWAKAIRKSYENQSTDSTMTTRRLVHVVRTYGITGNLAASVSACVARFDKPTATAFRQFYAALEPAKSTKTATAKTAAPQEGTVDPSAASATTL